MGSSAPSRISLLCFLITLVGCAPQEPPSRLIQFSGPTMGTRYNVKAVADGPAPEEEHELRAAVKTALDEVDAKMSHYVQDSELSQFNSWREEAPFPVSPELMEVLKHAIEISSATGGAFDVTVGPLVDAWGFGPPGRPAQPPAPSEIEKLLALTGWELLELDSTGLTMRKRHPDLKLDLSAIAKGYGVDRAADALDAAGVESYLIEVGGEVRTRGLNDQGLPWQIGIERPVPGERTIELIVPLSDLALATSGDYRNYYELNGKRISHTIDPRTGQPITHNVASVSVVGPLCVRADAYATALLVLGPAAGFDLAEDLGLAAYFLQRDKEGVFVGRMTAAFEQLIEGRSQE